MLKFIYRHVAVGLILGGMSQIHANAVDLSKIPQINETPQQRDDRMQWFRDAKFGMFIHWGPCSVGSKEIGWGRSGNHPWDNNLHGPRTSDPVYDNYYKQFNPIKYNAEEWVSFAKDSGMKYMVIITKHHDGFSMFDSKFTDYKITNSPFKRDIIKEFAEACQKQGMKLGLYYSTRDWYHPDYLVGDNSAYDTWYRSQIEELLTNYGKVDVMWFDHVGGQDWGKWKFDELFSMMYRLQPSLLVNNRAAGFIGPKTPEDRPPATPAIKKMTEGDFYSPEGVIGKQDVVRDWESCIHVGKGWAYRGEDGFKGAENCIKMLVSCASGGGSLLLNFGPRPDGSFAEGEAKVARAMGHWLKKYGEAIYGTRGGPYRNGKWGGSTHKGNLLFLHVYNWGFDGIFFDPLYRKVLSARNLSGGNVKYHQTNTELKLNVSETDRDAPVTVIELTLDGPLEIGKIIGGCRNKELLDGSDYGRILSANAKLSLSSVSEKNAAADHARLFSGPIAPIGYNFQTALEKNPWATIDLGSVMTVKNIAIENRTDEKNPRSLILSISQDGIAWTETWKSSKWEPKWLIPITRFHAGIDVSGQSLRYVKIESTGDQTHSLGLQRLIAYGE